jgi:hypothetical protein
MKLLQFVEFVPSAEFTRFARFAQRARTVSPPLILAGSSFSDKKYRPALSTLDSPLYRAFRSLIPSNNTDLQEKNSKYFTAVK